MRRISCVMRRLNWLALVFSLVVNSNHGSATEQLSTTEQIKAFFGSSDYQNRHPTDAEFINDLYRVVLQREPDPQGYKVWTAALRNGTDKPDARTKALEAFLKSPESKAIRSGIAAAGLSKDTTRNPGNVVFDTTGVLVNDASALPADRYMANLKKARVTWIALQIDNGGKARMDNISAIEKGWLKTWRAAGFKVGFWGVARGVTQHNSDKAVAESIAHVQSDAALAAKLTAEHGGDFYIADCEDPYQGYNQTDPTPKLNAVYVQAFQHAATAAGIGTIPRSLSSMGRVALAMQPWIENGWDAMPQAYWNSYAVYQPSKCVDFYVKDGGWPVGRVHPTIATYTGDGEKRSVSLQDYAADLKTRPTTGFSYYLPESYLGLNNDSGYEQLATMAGTGKY